MTGKTSSRKGKMLDRTQLGNRAACLVRDFARCRFATELPTTTLPEDLPRQSSSSEALPGASSAPRASRPRSPPSPLLPPPPPPPPPLRCEPVLTVCLTELKGQNLGGQIDLVALGELVEGDPRWQMDCPRTEGTQLLTLRVGYRVRRTVSRGALAGRTFEVWVERLVATQEVGLHGGPLWVGRELRSMGGLISEGTIIVGRRPGAASTPATLWSRLASSVGSAARVGNPNAWCGLYHPAIQALLDVAASPPSAPSLADIAASAAVVGSRSGGLGGLRQGGSQLQLIGKLAGDAFLLAMKAISPTAPKLVFQELLRRKEFQLNWLPEQLHNGLSKSKVRATTCPDTPQPHPPTHHCERHPSPPWRCRRISPTSYLSCPSSKASCRCTTGCTTGATSVSISRCSPHTSPSR